MSRWTVDKLRYFISATNQYQSYIADVELKRGQYSYVIILFSSNDVLAFCSFNDDLHAYKNS